jgi:cell division protein FtsQ
LVSGFVIVDLVALLGWGMTRLTDPASFPIRSVQIEGEFRQLKPERLQTLVARATQGGLLMVDVEAIRRSLRRDPWVKGVWVRRFWPDRLVVTVYEQRAVARWGKQGLLNEDGVLFKPAEDSYPPGLVRLSGPRGTEAQVLKKFHELEFMFVDFDIEVAELGLNPRRSWHFELNDGPCVMVGRAEFERRIQRFLARYAQLAGEGSGSLEHVDLRYTNGIAVRFKTREARTENKMEATGLRDDGEKA